MLVILELAVQFNRMYLALQRGLLVCAICCLSMLNFYPLSAQNQFTVFHYQANDYKGGNQNWDISKDSLGRVFVANNAGLLVFDGSLIRLIEMPEKTIVRSVACIGNKVFTGSFEEFGYWEETNDNEWIYTSLSVLIDRNRFKNDEIWKIVEWNNGIYFQSFGNIFKFDEGKVVALDLPGPVLFLIKSGGRLFVQQIKGGLLEIVNDQLFLIPGSEVFATTEIKSILQLDENKFIVGTSSMGLFHYHNNKFTEWKTEASEALKQNKINNGLVRGNQLIYGTILKGIYVIDEIGRLLHHLHTGNNLQNNTVLALQIDEDDNLWVGLDKGFDFVWFQSPIDVYQDANRESGSVYTAALFNNLLYVGTNQGIYYYQINKEGKFINRKMLENSQGQVWFLKVIDNQLYCGLNNGTYHIYNHKLEMVSDVSGGYNFIRTQFGDKHLMLQSTYNEIVVFEKLNGVWTKRKTLQGFNAPIRYFEIDHLGNFFLGHTISGLFLAQPSALFDSVIHYRKLSQADGLPINTNRVFRLDNRIVILTGENIYQWNAQAKLFEIYSELNEQLAGFSEAHTIISAGLNKYWFVKDNETGMFEIRFGKAKLLYRIVPKMFNIELIQHHENIVELNDSLHLICSENRFAILNILKMNNISEIVKAPVFKKIAFNKAKGNKLSIPIDEHSTRRYISNSFNNFSISFSAFGSVGRKFFFQTKLEGIDAQWSDWTTQTQFDYFRLPVGNFNFKVRSLTAQGMLTPEAVFHFRISPPWYLAWFSIVAYIVLIIIFAILLWNNYKRRQWKKQKQLLKEENLAMKQRSSIAEAELIQLSNEKLQSEIALKNMELAKNTMSIVRKNELLIEIKTELEIQREELKYRLPNRYFDRIYKLIDDSINSEHDWAMFESLFDQAHENFFKRIKQNYPELTPSDLRLCAYLRLNLASKEIAPLLNISVRGVEEKRYRLRKKMHLTADLNLTEYLMKF